ncbi:hypothetical protein BDV19DRAFT_384506 [Aspergillus venezuelensis]
MVLNFSSAEIDAELPPSILPLNTGKITSFPGYRSQNRKIKLEEFKARPAWLAELLAYEIKCCLDFGRDRVYFGKLMLRCLGKIEVFVDGEPFRDFNVAGRLRRLKSHPEGVYVPKWVDGIALTD